MHGRDDSATLVVFPDEAAARDLSRRLEAEGFAPTAVSSAAEALRAMDTGDYRLALVSAALRVGKLAVPLIQQVTERWPDVPVIGLVDGGSGPAVLAAMRAGAADAVDHQVAGPELAGVLDRVSAASPPRDDVPPAVSVPVAGLLGESAIVVSLREQIERAADTPSTVLVRGESGTGKELVARALHAHSGRRHEPFVKVNCAGLPETLLDSELFGHDKGAFTGAIRTKPGRVEVARGGTLFLDEIGDVTPLMQIKLLRLLQDREYERLGSNQTRTADVRFVTATHRDLDNMVAAGEFREDLFYRLNVVPIWVPPLRARRDDIELLARHFFDRFTSLASRTDLELSDDAVAFLTEQRWPGNVRELQNVVERVVVMAPGPEITRDTVQAEIQERTSFSTQAAASLRDASSTAAVGASVVLPLDEEMRAAEKRVLDRALTRAAGSRAKAARLLGIGRTTLYRKMAEHGLT